MNKQELIKKLNESTNIGIAKCKKLLTILSEIIVDALKKGQEINFCNIGKMKIKRTTKTKFYCPSTQSIFIKKPKNKLVFRPSKMLNDSINF